MFSFRFHFFLLFSEASLLSFHFISLSSIFIWFTYYNITSSRLLHYSSSYIHISFHFIFHFTASFFWIISSYFFHSFHYYSFIFFRYYHIYFLFHCFFRFSFSFIFSFQIFISFHISFSFHFFFLHDILYISHAISFFCILSFQFLHLTLAINFEFFLHHSFHFPSLLFTAGFIITYF